MNEDTDNGNAEEYDNPVQAVTPLMKRFQEAYKRLSRSDQEALERKAVEIIARRQANPRS